MKINDKLTKNLLTVLESGKNYTKYSDGTLICTGEKSFSNISMLAYGSLYRSVSIKFDDFPVEFVDVPNVSYSLKESNSENGSILNRIIMPTKTFAGNVCIVKENNKQVSGTLSYRAIGKWK